jgi:cytochrome c oxidase subunit 2
LGQDGTWQAPPLTGLNDWCLLAQLQNYRDGIRRSNPDDNYGVQILSDDQAMQNVVRYITTLHEN